MNRLIDGLDTACIGTSPPEGRASSARWFCIVAIAAVILATASQARADSVVVSGGQMMIGNGEVALQLLAPGVAIDTSYLTDGSPLLEQWFVGACSPSCAPGAQIPLQSNYMFVGYGSATVDGTLIAPIRGQIQLVFQPPTTLVAPPISGGPARMSAPFTLVDGFYGSAFSSFYNPGVTPAYEVGLLGNGRVEFDLLPTSSGRFTLGPSVMFDFGSPSPTPEPASLFLLVTALAGLVSRRRRTGTQKGVRRA